MSKKEFKKIQELRLSFSDFQPMELAEGEEKKRRFRGVAYTGAVIPRHGWTQNLVIDLDGVNFKDQIPIFLNHNPDQIAGHGFMETDGEQLFITGELYEFGPGEEIRKTSDAGFAWELSVGVSAEYVLEMGEEEKRTVNGRELEGFHTLLRVPRVTETSFVPIGADSNTNVNIFSKWFGSKNEPSTFEAEVLNEQRTSEDEDMEVKELQEKLEKALAKIEEFETKEKKAEIEAKFSGFTVSDEDKDLLSSAYLSGDEVQVALADRILVTLAEEKVEEEAKEEEAAEEAEKAEAEKKEEEAKEEAEKAEELAKKEEAVKAMPKELFKQEEINEGNVQLAQSGKSLLEMAEELKAKNPSYTLQQAIFEAKKLKHQAQ